MSFNMFLHLPHIGSTLVTVSQLVLISDRTTLINPLKLFGFEI